MARRAREIGASGLYHIYFKAVGNDKLFRCNEDCDKFVHFIANLSGRMEIIAYGLNKTDGHLFVKTFELSSVMKKLMTDYAMWFNKKYKRSGVLFGSRYKSEPIEADFAPGLARYIVQHGEYNSLKELEGGNASDTVLSHFSSASELSAFMKKLEPYTYGADSPINTAAVDRELQAALGGKSFLTLSNDERVSAVKRLSDFGLKKSAIARFTGVSRGTVVRCLKIEEDKNRAEQNRRREELVLL